MFFDFFPPKAKTKTKIPDFTAAHGVLHGSGLQMKINFPNAFALLSSNPTNFRLMSPLQKQH
jgi:hypothetical protein